MKGPNLCSIIALVKNEIRIVQASLIGSLLANLLLILGMAFLIGGLEYQEQIYDSTVVSSPPKSYHVHGNTHAHSFLVQAIHR